ncbi:zinc finger and SCAN domain-containing protein 23-like [Drosophila tropicalis]|uniref:zinc finger and SCAN domain-containing protein 23-like n=1 Tax=Drosophila tropicalis TaxID=46794 RepID=UPI0035AB8DA4
MPDTTTTTKTAGDAGSPGGASTTQKWIVCRVCLQQPKEPMSSIFNDDAKKDMTNMILECGGVPIKKFDHYPDKICDKCHQGLQAAFKFRRTCQRSYKHLSQFIAPVEVETETSSQTKNDMDDTAMEEDDDEVEEQQLHQQERDCEGEANHEEQGVLEVEEESDNLLMEMPKEDMVQVKSEQVEEDGIIEELYDVYETFDADGDIITEHAAFQQQQQDSLSGLSAADIEYLDQVDHLNENAQESAREEQHHQQLDDDQTEQDDELLEQAGVDEEFITIKTRSAALGRRRATQRLQDTSRSSSIRTNQGIKTRGGHKILVGDKKIFKYICDVCGNMYPSQSRLTEHIKVHSGVKPHECEICGHCFAQAQQLARHMNTHTGNRPYKCSYCPAAFADLSTRNKHHRIHTNERPYECDVCHKTFTYTNTLKFHKMIHTGEKPHVCDICGKGFPQAYKLRNHRVIHERRGVTSSRDLHQADLAYEMGTSPVGLEM